MQPPLLEKTISLQEFVKIPIFDSYKLENFNFILGAVSDSASGYMYKRNTNTGTLTSVYKSVCLNGRFYTNKRYIETKIENPQEFEKLVYDILFKSAWEEPERCSANSTFKLKCFNQYGKEILNVIEKTDLPKWYKPLCEYLDSYFVDYVD